MESRKIEVAGPSKQELELKGEEKAFEEEEEDDDDDENHPKTKEVFGNFVPSPLLPLKEQIEKDKFFNLDEDEQCRQRNVQLCRQAIEIFKKEFLDEDEGEPSTRTYVLRNREEAEARLKRDKIEDESLRRWKEKLLGGLESDFNGNMEPEVEFHSIGIISSDFGEIITPFPISADQSKQILFTLHEGSEYQLKLTFSVLHNIVSGLAYTNTVWKGGIQVDQSRGMLGTFAPQKAPYVHTLEEETTPSGVLARGVYTAKLKFEDDDKRRHLELNYSFEIRMRH